MPQLNRLPVRMNCNGIDLMHPVDRMPPGYFPYLFNARQLVDGRIDSRPGYTPLNSPSAIKLYHSIRRLNDVSGAYNAAGYTYILGNGTTLMAGPETLPNQIDNGYSGNPLSLLTFRPENSPVSWMYVYDANKQVKVRPDGVLRSIGLPPPATPVIEYAAPATVQIANTQDVGAWVGYDGSGVITVTKTDRTNGSVSTVAAILYATGNTGWCCINPTTASSFFWAGERMEIVLNTGAGNAEQISVREIHPAIDSTTIAAIAYDSGVNGLCTVVLVSSPPNLERNSLVQLGAEVVRVLSVTYSSDDQTYSFRCSTTGTHAAGDAVTGLISWFAYTTLNHSIAETITEFFLLSGSATDPALAELVTVNAAVANGRPVSISDDYLHISVFLQNPQLITNLFVQIDVDANTTTVGGAGNAFTKNYYTWTVSKAELNDLGVNGAQGNAWTELLLPLSAGVRSGNDLTRTLANIQALQVKAKTTGATALGIDSWYLFGTYGPVIQPSQPTGYFYETRNRDSTTGVASVPGAQTRYALFPLREGVVVQPDSTLVNGVDVVDIYREGGTLADFVYVGSSFRSGGVTPPFTDAQPDLHVAANPGPDLTALQPWPLLRPAWQGVVNVAGTRVSWVSGTQFDTNLIAGTVIIINGTAYQTYGQPISATELEIAVDAGVQTGVAYEIESPEIAAQPLPFAFGPLEGPFAPIIFGLGDPNNPGFLYYTNTANADGASDQNSVEVCPPSEPLIGGGVWSSYVFTASQDNVYFVRYSYLGNVQQFQVQKIPAASGQWNRYASCVGPDGWYYVGRDGIYRADPSGAECVTNAQLYPLFPHDGQPAAPEHDLYPVNMTMPMRLSACDSDVYFDYMDTAGNSVTLRYEVLTKRWWPHYYATGVVTHYLVERSVSTPGEQEILLLSKTLGQILQAGGDTDDGTAIETIVHTPSFDGGDERSQKLYQDFVSDIEGAGNVAVALGFNNNVSFGAVQTIASGAARNQYLVNQDSQANLALYRNVSAKYAWTGGPSGPKLYAFEPSWYNMPYLSRQRVTQYIKPAGVQGWLHHRRLYAALISTADVQFVVKTQDGRSYGPYTLPNTAGQLRIWPIMLDQNIKDLAFSYEATGDGTTEFALFDDDFVIEMKEWQQASYALVPVFKA
jgi:hypothetical protein